MRADLPRFAERTTGTPRQNEAFAKGAIAYYGGYKVNETDNSISVIIGSSFATFNATDSIRTIAFPTTDTLKTTN